MVCMGITEQSCQGEADENSKLQDKNMELERDNMELKCETALHEDTDSS